MTVSGSAPFRFDNPVKNDMLPCSEFNLNTTKLDPGFSIREKVGVCHAIEKIANKTKTTKWSKPVREEIENIWSSFLSSDVKIAPMPQKMSGRVAAAVKAVLPSGNGRMKATLYLRPEKTGSSRFFLTVMHELRHVYDYEQIWKTRSALTEAEMERRGFRTMGRIAAETPEKESFFRLPKLWDEDWANLSPTQIERLREDRIERYMSKSRFYKHLIKEPNKYIVGYLGSPVRNSAGELTLQNETREGSLPYLVDVNNSWDERKQNVAELDFTPAKADSSNPEALLQAAIKNEKNLYYRTSSFVYDQSVELNCWKKRKVAEKLVDSLQVSRTERGEVLKRRKIEGVRVRAPKCVVDLNAINTDTYETFWAAPYLDQMEVKFDRFSELDGKKVARFSVSKPDKRRFERIAKEFPFVKPFRVFFGTLFVSAEDAQIVKFWGSSYPQAATTGIKSEDVHAGYNATAVREKLESGLWVTTKLNTVAVARTKGKDRPFSYVVNYSNYRQTETEVEVLDDEEIVASN